MYLKCKEKAVLIGTDNLIVTNKYYPSSDEEVPAINPSGKFCLFVGAEPIAVSPNKDVLIDFMGWILSEWNLKPNGVSYGGSYLDLLACLGNPDHKIEFV